MYLLIPGINFNIWHSPKYGYFNPVTINEYFDLAIKAERGQDLSFTSTNHY